MNVLNLVTTGDASFFRKQVDTLDLKGIESKTLAIGQKSDKQAGFNRSPHNYVRLYLETLFEAVNEYDLLHVHYGLIAPIALGQPQRPVVLTLWGSDLMNDGWVSHVSRFSAEHCDAVILPSPAMSDYLSTPSHVIPFGVDMQLFRPMDQATARERINWDHDGPIVLFPNSKGREVKNYHRAKRIVDSLSDNVELRCLTGEPYQDVPFYMNASDAVLVTSKREAGPMVIKEAAACNVPVFSTNVGFARDVLEPIDNSGVCTSNAEFVTRLEDVLRTGTRSNGREQLAGNSLDEMGDRIIEVYHSVIK